MVFFHSGSIWRLYLAGAFLLITNGGDQSSESRCDTPLFLPPKETTATLSFCHKIQWHVVLLMIFLMNDKTPRIWTNSKPSVDPIASYNMPPPLFIAVLIFPGWAASFPCLCLHEGATDQILKTFLCWCAG